MKPVNQLVQWCRDSFLDHLLKDKDSAVSLTEWLDGLLGVAERTIVYVQAKEGFSVPGHYIGDSVHPRIPKDMFFRAVSKGEVLTVRKDVRDTHWTIERESVGCFTLQERDWESVKQHLKCLDSDGGHVFAPRGRGHRN